MKYSEILEKLSLRTISYIKKDLDMSDIKDTFTIEDVQKVDYKDITTLISLSGSLTGTIGMSVSKELAKEMVKNFVYGEVNEQTLEELSSENVAETLNITLGNILSDLEAAKNGKDVEISTPYTMHNSVTITKKKNETMNISLLKYNNEDIIISYFYKNYNRGE